MWLLCRLCIVIACLQLVPHEPLASAGDAEQQPSFSGPNREEILGVFKRAIELHEDFKQTRGKIPLEEQQRKRDNLEKYHEEVLDSKLTDCVALLSSRSDQGVATAFFRLLLSHENSADEELSYSLGEVFLNNPHLIEETLEKFEKPQQQLLYERLERGWQNVIYQKDQSDRKVRDRMERLQRLGNRYKERMSCVLKEASDSQL